ncbi:contactin-associated protein 1 isoform X1 [Erpetoichthys calabaricus]|uniref:contactin-associated protein 1 isoform X1 n=2 Tax=Erpetoichthys calabaricus TaxID=27687 RepID=UPI00223402D8|nr:contactin-associated protein 1 isoform X1 [Erpetoichthys calabaricus]
MHRTSLSLVLLCALVLHTCLARPCRDALVSPLYASSFLASSKYSVLYSPNLARLHGSSGWSPSPSDQHPWLQINLNYKYRITGISTQGTFNSNDWVTKYMLLYGDRPDSWKPYVQRAGNMTFAGNWNNYQVKRHYFHYAITAKHVRFLPMEWNPDGKIGVRLELYGCYYGSYVMAFDGDDVMSYRFRKRTMRTLQDVISLNFKTLEKEGLLLHSEGSQGDFLTLELHDSKLVLHISLGSSNTQDITGNTTVSLGNLLDDQHWHYATIHRYGRHVNFTLDGQTNRFICNGNFDNLDLDNEIYVGGVINPVKPYLPHKHNFRGCMENVFYNGVNIIDLAKSKDTQIRFPPRKKPVRYACQDVVLRPMTFNGANNYLQVPGPMRKIRMSVKFKFRSWDTIGLLMFTSFADKTGSLEMVLSDGQVNITMTIAGKKPLKFAAGYRLNNGFWHSVDLVARDGSVTVIIDEEEGSPFRVNSEFTLRTGDKYFFGGCPKVNNDTDCLSSIMAFHGCMQQIFIDGEPIDVDIMQRRRWGVSFQILHGTCAFTDRCTPNLCEHEGRCIQSWDDFICNCDNTGYKGEVCHKSVFKESCEAYRLSGKISSGNYSIDPDGSGPLKPFFVYCNMKVDKGLTVVHHNRIYTTKVSGSTMEQPFVGDVLYNNASWDEVSMLANNSLFCEQYIEYNCYKSRLLNTQSGSPYAFWIGRNDQRHFYWGGSYPGIRKCDCGIRKDCTDNRFFCNCDADYRQWYSDKGILKYTDHMPVTRVVIGDTNRTGSEATFYLGPLRCYGDRNTWNTVTFQKVTHMLFPTFRPGTSADISFYFKTTADFGVFLENSGYRHYNFIRLEMNTTTDMAFVFNVGDGIDNVTFRSSFPLNNDEWHYVKAEINAKLARIKVDNMTWVVRRFPPHTYISMEFNKPLLVGAAENKVQGFLGCLRGLRMNGVTLDLEGKANDKEGIKQNCTGFCWNPKVPCRNAGRCIERYSAYECDCNNTAYDGMFCHRDIGAYFEQGTWVRYTIRSAAITAAAEFASYVDAYNFSLGYNQTSEEMSLSFRTTQSPAVLMYISSFTPDYIALILRKDGSLELRYKLGLLSPSFVASQRNLSDGQPHIVNITRTDRDIRIEVDYTAPLWMKIPLISSTKFDSPKSMFLGRVMETGRLDPEIQKYNSPGFTGCMSGVRFNNIAPLKFHFRPNGTLFNLSISGNLYESNCGAMPWLPPLIPLEADPWYIKRVLPYLHDDLPSGPVLALIILLVLLLLVGLPLFLYFHFYRYKGTYTTNEPKTVESPSSAKPLTEAPRKGDNLPQIEEEEARGE